MRRVIWGILSISVLLAFTRFGLLSLFMMLGLIAYVTSVKKERFRQSVWVYLVFFSGCIAVYQIAWLLKVSVSPLAVLLLLGVISAAVIALYKPRPNNKNPAAPPAGWAGLAAGIAVCLYVSLPIIFNPSYGTVLRYAAKTGDDINHIAMIEADRKTEGLIYTQNRANSRLLDSSFVGYPQGWHANGALFESLFLKLIGKDSLGTRLLSYYLYKLLWLFLATYLSFELLSALLKTFYRRPAEPYLLGAIAGILSLFLLVPLFGYGFQNFIAAIALVLAAVILACGWLRSAAPGKKSLYIAGLALITAASVAVWVLPGLIVGLLTAGVVIKELLAGRQNVNARLWAVLSIAAILAAGQLYAVSAGSHGKASSLNLGGSTPPISYVGVGAVLALALAAIVKRPAIRKKWLIFIAVLGSSEFILLAAYQRIFLGSIRYYAIKLAFLTALLVSLVLLAAVIDLGYIWKRRLWLNSALLILLVAAVPLVLGLDLRKSAYPLKNSAPITLPAAKYILSLNPSNPNQLISTGDKGETYLATKLWSDSRPYSSPQRQKLLDSLDYKISH